MAKEPFTLRPVGEVINDKGAERTPLDEQTQLNNLFKQRDSLIAFYKHDIESHALEEGYAPPVTISGYFGDDPEAQSIMKVTSINGNERAAVVRYFREALGARNLLLVSDGWRKDPETNERSGEAVVTSIFFNDGTVRVTIDSYDRLGTEITWQEQVMSDNTSTQGTYYEDAWNFHNGRDNGTEEKRVSQPGGEARDFTNACPGRPAARQVDRAEGE